MLPDDPVRRAEPEAAPPATLARRGGLLAAGWIVLLYAVLWWIYWHPAAKELFVDEWQYFWYSENVRLGRPVNPDLIWPPGQALLLAAFRRLFGDLAPAIVAMQLLHTVLLLAVAALTADLGRRATGSRTAGAAAGLLLLAHPSMLAFSHYLFAEPAFLALLLLALWLPAACRGRPRKAAWAAAAAGAAWGLTQVFKSGAAYAWPLWLILLRPPAPLRPLRGWLPRLAFQAALFLAAGGLVTVPARLESWRLHRDPVIADSSPFGMWVGLHEQWRSDAYKDTTGRLLAEYFASAETPAERRSLYRRRIRAEVAERGLLDVLRYKLAYQPYRLLNAKTNLVTQLPGPVCRGHNPRYRDPPAPAVAGLVLASHGMHLATLTAFAFGLAFWRRWREPTTWVLLGLLGYFAAVFFVGHAESRYALWIWPLLCVFAGGFVVQLAACTGRGARLLASARRPGLRWAAGALLAALLAWWAFAAPYLDRMCT